MLKTPPALSRDELRSALANATPVDLTRQAGRLILQGAGEDLAREGILRTPERFAKAMQHLTSGYLRSLESVVGEGVFAAEGSGLVVVRDVEFYSLCEHHMLPFWGKASVAYYPRNKIVGLSKIPRIVDLFAQRFQVQERLTQQVGEGLKSIVDARAVFVRVRAQHMCMMMRGVEKQGSDTVTEWHSGLETLSPYERERIGGSVE
jgi:GTP cyclohydrolase I